MLYDKKLIFISISVFPLLVSSGMIYSILPLYIAGLGASEMHIGLIFTTGAIVGAITSPFIGKVSDRYGRKPIIILSMIIFVFVFIAYAFTKNYTKIFPIQAFEGFAWAVIGTVVPAWMTDLVGIDKKGEVLGIFNGTWYLGWIIGPTFGGYLANIYGFRFVFLVCSIMIAIGLIFIIFSVSNNKVQ